MTTAQYSVMKNTRDLDFASLSLRDALDLAILIEEEARERYVELADQLAIHRTEGAAAFFRRMARVEEKHRDELTARRRESFGTAPTHVSRSMIFDIEAPSYDSVRTFMTERQALLTSLDAEEKAHAFFVAALPHVTDPAVHELFAHLRDEEVEHQRLVKSELSRRDADEPVSPSDFGDDPVAQ